MKKLLKKYVMFTIMANGICTLAVIIIGQIIRYAHISGWMVDVLEMMNDIMVRIGCANWTNE